jgi:hypothetical protein
MIKEVTKEYINEVIENRSEHIGERVYLYTKSRFVACDNLDGEAWVEEFTTEEEAISWLNGDFDTQDLKKRRKEVKR